VFTLVCEVRALAYDLALLDPMVVVGPPPSVRRAGAEPVLQMCWYTAARELVRQMQVAYRAGLGQQCKTLRSQVDVIRYVAHTPWRVRALLTLAGRAALVQLGERIPLGFRQVKLLDDLLQVEVSERADLEQLLFAGML